MEGMISAKGARSLVEEYKQQLFEVGLRNIQESIINACHEGKYEIDVEFKSEQSIAHRILNFLKGECAYKASCKENDGNSYTFYINWSE